MRLRQGVVWRTRRAALAFPACQANAQRPPRSELQWRAAALAGLVMQMFWGAIG